MKSNILITAIVMLRSLLTTAKLSIVILTRGAFGKLSRSSTDRQARQWAEKMLQIIKLDCAVYNSQKTDFSDKKKPYIIMINHSSLYDIPITYYALPGTIRMIAKKELFKIPVFGRAMRHAEIPSIDRQNRKQAVKDLHAAQELMNDGVILWMAPEGTRSRDGKLGSLKKGGFIMAIRSGATIIPVGIRNADKILPAKTWQFHLHQKTEVHIGEGIDASNYTLDKKEVLMDMVAKQLRELAAIS